MFANKSGSIWKMTFMASKRYLSEIEQSLANIFLRMNSYAFNGICLTEK
jgi:hypothetical protein